MSPPVPANTYQTEIDFTSLSLQYPNFAKKLKSNRQLDFSDPESVKQLTLSILHRDFDLTSELPDDRLCPPVPNRFNYVLFLQRLLDSTSPTFRDSHDPKREVVGLDIGTGASAIYPLLGCRQYPKWKFLCTEIDEKSKQYAEGNIQQNGLDDRIRLVDCDTSSRMLIPLDAVKQVGRLDFVMTNPPFYSSSQEMLESAKSKSRPPNSACTGSEREMIYPYTSESAKQKTSKATEGGEVAFVGQLINESVNAELRSRIQWFSSMLGKLASLSILIQKLKELRCTNYAVTEFIQGQKTRRWCIAWSWQSLRPPAELARSVPALEKKLLPFPSDFVFEIDGKESEAGTSVDEVLEQLEDEDEDGRLSWQWKSHLAMGLGMAKEDCWSRKARRKRKGDREMKEADGEDEQEGTKEPALVFKISVKQDQRVRLEEGKVVVTVRWWQGSDSVLFESFCGWLKRKMGSK